MFVASHGTGAGAASRASTEGREGVAARVFVTDQGSEGVIRESLSALGLQDTRFANGDVTAAITALSKESSPQLLVVDISGIADPLGKMRELADVCGPNISVVVIGDRNDIVLLPRAEADGNERVFPETARQKPFHRRLQIDPDPGIGESNHPHRQARSMCWEPAAGPGPRQSPQTSPGALPRPIAVTPFSSISTCRRETPRCSSTPRAITRFGRRSIIPSASTSYSLNAG